MKLSIKLTLTIFCTYSLSFAQAPGVYFQGKINGGSYSYVGSGLTNSDSGNASGLTWSSSTSCTESISTSGGTLSGDTSTSVTQSTTGNSGSKGQSLTLRALVKGGATVTVSESGSGDLSGTQTQGAGRSILLAGGDEVQLYSNQAGSYSDTLSASNEFTDHGSCSAPSPAIYPPSYPTTAYRAVNLSSISI